MFSHVLEDCVCRRTSHGALALTGYCQWVDESLGEERGRWKEERREGDGREREMEGRERGRWKEGGEEERKEGGREVTCGNHI